MEIEKPRTGYLYVFDREILHIGKTVAIGRITVEVNAKISFGKYELKVIAHGDDNEAEDTIDLWKFL